MDTAGRHIEVRGTRLYVYDLGDTDAPALVYLHGGPGMGCHEFVHWQGPALSGRARLIAFDQRGSHHSDVLGAGEPLSEDDIVEDCEALRRALGPRSWFVLGHSFGGRIALRYAARYPGSVRGVVFENPVWSIESTQRFRMPVFAELYERHGRTRQAAACRDFAARPQDFADDPMGKRFLEGLAELGEAWYLYDRSGTGFLDGVGMARPHPAADATAAALLARGPQVTQDLRPLLAGLVMPARLIVGEADLATSPDQIESFAAVFGPEHVHRVGEAGHFVQGERPESHARLVLGFLDAVIGA
jgi:proline iminopeptidase